ncbi:MAG: signal peptidase II [Herbinix sp.]|nr:signal peptidase II [Herbinix sp.]
MTNRIKYLKKILPIFLLVMLDQAIKLYIAKFLMDKKFIIGNILGFKPYLNVKYSWINSMTNMGISLTLHILLVIVLLLCILIIYDFIETKYSMNTYGHSLFAFLIAGAACSLIDKVAWGGSLDYVLLNGFFIFDLKDCYISVFEVMLILSLFKSKEVRNAKGRVLIKGFSDYFKIKYLKKFRKSV